MYRLRKSRLLITRIKAACKCRCSATSSRHDAMARAVPGLTIKLRALREISRSAARSLAASCQVSKPRATRFLITRINALDTCKSSLTASCQVYKLRKSRLLITRIKASRT